MEFLNIEATNDSDSVVNWNVTNWMAKTNKGLLHPSASESIKIETCSMMCPWTEFCKEGFCDENSETIYVYL